MPITESTLVLETGSGLDTANSYQSISGASGYHARVGNDLWFDYNADQQAQALVSGSRFIDQRFRFVGHKLTAEQTLQWPRYGVYDADYFLWEDAVPTAVAEATAEYALLAIGGTLLYPQDLALEGAVTSRSESIGPHSESVSYAVPVRMDLPRFPEQDRILVRSGLIRGRSHTVIHG